MKIIYKYKNFIKVSRFDFNKNHIKVKHFHRIDLSNAVMMICEVNKKFLILKEFRIGLNKYSWGLPGGFIEANESPMNTVIREFYEETGIKIKSPKLMLSYVRNGNYNCGKDYIFYKKLHKSKKLNLEKNVKYKLLTKTELVEFIKKKKFETVGVIASLLYFLKLF